jgi:RNA recognition motif-containing protein
MSIALASSKLEAAAFCTPSTSSSIIPHNSGLYMAKNTNSNTPKRPPTFGADGLLAAKNKERVKMAGRKGTKRFVDPCKVFLGNLPFDATEQDVKQFLAQNLGTTFHVKSIKIIYDWKTNKSKGYGFALFTDPMFATSAMEVLDGRKLKGRPMTLSQGKKKPKENELYIKKEKKRILTKEEEAIQAGLEEALSNDDDDHDTVVMEVDDFDEADDALLFESEDDDDDDEFEFDGIFEEIYPSSRYQDLTEEEQQLNREQRRNVAKRKKRRKLPHKGFEPPPEEL